MCYRLYDNKLLQYKSCMYHGFSHWSIKKRMRIENGATSDLQMEKHRLCFIRAFRVQAALSPWSSHARTYTQCRFVDCCMTIHIHNTNQAQKCCLHRQMLICIAHMYFSSSCIFLLASTDIRRIRSTSQWTHICN